MRAHQGNIINIGRFSEFVRFVFSGQVMRTVLLKPICDIRGCFSLCKLAYNLLCIILYA